MMRPIHLLLAAVPVLFAACSSTPLEETKAPVSTASPSPARETAAPTQVAPSSAVTPVAVQPTPVAAAERERSVYFDFDDYSVKNEYMTLLEQQGKLLSAKPGSTIRIEGNTDERGSAEYNLALGQRRAQAVLRVLKLYGVKDSQAEAVSWGKERPRQQGHDESAWAANRRADIVNR
jgi:peptidoglycan-associated lipoprotein